ncbi:MAG: murein transglycosylase A [Salaquimonas sp.]
MTLSAIFKKTSFAAINGWQDEDHLAALSCFRVSARRMQERAYSTKTLGVDGALLAKAGNAALAINPASAASGKTARQFFEDWFLPYLVKPESRTEQGFVTGYFEPEIEASIVKTDKFKFPILKRPPDLVAIEDDERPSTMDESFFFARKTDNQLSEYHDRRAIENGALDDMELELFWFENRIDIFFIQIQGSARLVMPDGSIKRVSYAGKSGHPFTPIGKLLIERGELTLETVTMQSIRQWLENHPHEANELMWQNRSYIFFQEIDHPNAEMGPVAAAGVPLTPGRSLAVDHRLQTFGTPIWVATDKPIPGSSDPFARLMIAQDTGSAIVGPARGDLFIGTGFEAGEVAGGVKNTARFIVFVPRDKEQ